MSVPTGPPSLEPPYDDGRGPAPLDVAAPADLVADGDRVEDTPMGKARRTRIVAVAAAVLLLVLVAGGILIGRPQGGEDSYDAVVLYDEASGDVFLTTAGDPATQENRFSQGAQPGQIAWLDDGQVKLGWNAPYDGKHLVLLYEGGNNTLNLVADGGAESETIFETSGSIEVFVRGDQVMISERRLSGANCYSGVVGEIERIYRGDRCQMSAGGQFLTWKHSGDVIEAVMLEDSGDETFSGDFDSEPDLTMDGTMLVHQDRSGNLEIIDVVTGEVIVDVEADDGADFAVGPGGSIATVASDNGESRLELHEAGRSTELENLDPLATDMAGWFTETGDFMWTVVGRRGRPGTEIRRWDHQTGDIATLGEGSLAGFDEVGDAMVLAWIVDDGLELERVNSDGTVDSLWAVADSEMWSVEVRQLEGDHVSVLYRGDRAGFAVVNVKTGETEWTDDDWDAVWFFNHGSGGGLVTAIDGDLTVLFLLEASEPRELMDAEAINTAGFVGDNVMAEAQDGYYVVSYFFDLAVDTGWPTATYENLNVEPPLTFGLDKRTLTTKVIGS